MIPIKQTVFGSPHGNCFQACIASVLELPLENVPHFCDGNNSRWLLNLEVWLSKRGLAPVFVNAKECPALDEVWTLASGPSERGIRHSVVYKGMEMMHDPHTDQTGLTQVEDFLFLVKVESWR